jgi:FkbM family methyltransferase
MAGKLTGDPLLRAAALAPVSLKSALFRRIVSRYCRAVGSAQSDEVISNLGLTQELRCRIPIARMDYAFGRPNLDPTERSTLALALTLAPQCTHFLDIGANYGLYTFAMHRELGDDISLHWFEPDPKLFTRLSQNIEFNAISAAANEVAVSDVDGAQTFYENLTDDSSGSIHEYFSAKHETRAISVRAITLDTYLRSRDIKDALVKVDVEGAGASVWSGAAASIDRVKFLLMEIIEPETNANLVHSIISQSSLNAYYIRDFDLVHSRDGSFDYVAPFWNWLFCSLAPTELDRQLAGRGFRIA